MAACKRLSLSAAAELLKSRDGFLILTHSSPDGDTLGAAFGLKGLLEQLGKSAEVICDEGVPTKFDFLGKAYEGTVNAEGHTVVAVDVADKKLLGDISAGLCEHCELCIDHHPTNTEYASALLLDGSASAACEVMLALAAELGVIPDKAVATALYTGIATDTGCFKYSNTTAATHLAAAELIKLGAEHEAVNRSMFETVTRGRLLLERSAYENMRYFENGLVALTVLDYEVLSSEEADASATDAVAAIPRTIEGVAVGVTLKEKEKGIFKVSVRSFLPYDASRICAELGGGGHACAAGCRLEGDRETAVAAVLQSVRKEINRNGDDR